MDNSYLKFIRNFSIIAHIDHGKSTLADRLLEYTGTIEKRKMKEQFLDSMELERERGITIKAKAVQLKYLFDNNEYTLNLIDTPGHVDFSYEVSRSLRASDGAILVVDASQGIEAQTLANAHIALGLKLPIIPVVNKIDLPNADIEKTENELKEMLNISPEDCILASAKEGIGTKEILDAIIRKIPPPIGDINAPLNALIMDAQFDFYKGVIVFVRVYDGIIKKGMKIKMMAAGSVWEVTAVGIFKPEKTETDILKAGNVGYIEAGIKSISDIKIGDTITDAQNPTSHPQPGYREVKPMVFCGLFPVLNEQYEELKDALQKLKLNDASLFFEPESSEALGFGFRCGFLGLLHMEIIQERLEREYNLNLIATAPNVEYKIITTSGEIIMCDNPALFPDFSKIEAIEEPYVKVSIITPSEYIGPLMQLCQSKRGIYITTEYLTVGRALIVYEMPLSEIIWDFYDKLKSCTRGYATMDYEIIDYRPGDLKKVDILVNHEKIDSLSFIIHKDFAYRKAKSLVEKLKEVIPRQLFPLPIQGAIGGQIIARETIPALRKDVLAKCYGGDITRKRKLLEKQKEGKKRMKQFGSVEIPQEAFLAILKVE
ncbi:MAG: translation elongation factor 4 [Candidatus Goldbacteria bacterium]|nr:translation elongation factor 4 [Candidatus Goldiibacteriota bacterium]